jgi:uncharacterized repeat protein (TIGR03803 family)
MNNPMRHRRRILGIYRRAAVTALALAVMLVLTVLTAGSAQAQTYTESVLHTFTGPPNGALLTGSVLDAQGNLYGTTGYGGDSACDPPYGCGSVFKLDTAGAETVLYSFSGTGGDGANPWASLVRDAKGNLYGTTVNGGDLACNTPDGCGSVFKLDTAGAETVLYSFTGGPDGADPFGGLVLDARGNLYGTTKNGGAYGYGTVFKLAPPVPPSVTWTETVLYSFTGSGGGGAEPMAGLLQDPQGNLYGTTKGGGAYSEGTAFELDTTGKEIVLYSFCSASNCADGAVPWAGLVRDVQGNLYGTARFGGDLACDAPDGCGTVFKLDTTGNETVLHTFTGSGGDGADPFVGLVRDAQGNLYGTTFYGGDLSCNDGGGSNLGCGVVFKLATTNTETVLYSFTGTGGDGAYPLSELVRDAQGNLYGGNAGGGDLACTTGTIGQGTTLIGCGTLFKLTPPTATKTTLTSSPNPSTYGQAVTFTAVVTSKAGTPPDGETVSFMEGKTVLGTGTLSSGSASYTTSTLKVGTNSITAVYGGDSNFAGSTSKAVKQVVSKATTTSTLVSSLNPSNVGQSVTFTASVTPQFSGTVTGKVAFYDGTTLLKSVSLSGGEAKYTTSKLTAGTHTITGTYDGSTDFTTSSASLTQTVN